MMRTFIPGHEPITGVFDPRFTWKDWNTGYMPISEGHNPYGGIVDESIFFGRMRDILSPADLESIVRKNMAEVYELNLYGRNPEAISITEGKMPKLKKNYLCALVFSKSANHGEEARAYALADIGDYSKAALIVSAIRKRLKKEFKQKREFYERLHGLFIELGYIAAARTDAGDIHYLIERESRQMGTYGLSPAEKAIYAHFVNTALDLVR